MDLVSATDLDQWAARRDAQSELPRIVRRLVSATANQPLRNSIRAGEGVSLPGWDGVVEAAEPSLFVPSGLSVWEMGVGDPSRKAQEDYAKRTSHPGTIDPSTATFVFVTPRRWPRKDAWVAARNREGIWKQVAAFDADDVEAWLETAPAVHSWLSSRLGKDPYEAESLETWWEGWSGATEPALPAQLFLSGREGEVDQLRNHLLGGPGAFSLKADSQDEALAFAFAAMHEVGDLRGIERALVVRSPRAWKRLSGHNTPLVLLPTFESPQVASATRQGHQVLLPLGPETPSKQGIHLPRLRRAGIESALEQTGIPSDRASTLATRGRRSLIALRRSLAINPDVEVPAWARAESAVAVLPAVLAGEWHDSEKGDREALADIANRSYEDVARALTGWLHSSDPPIRRVGDAWMIADKSDAWALLSRHLTSDDVERFAKVAKEVLGVEDPTLELPPDQRIMADLLGRRRKYGPLLTKGVADTIALLAATSDSVPLPGGRRGAEVAKSIVRSLLSQANEDHTGHRWQSLAPALPLLAEAAPEALLDALEAGLRIAVSPIVKLFQDGANNSILSPGSPHVHLLWALETIAWSPEHLPRVALQLAALARLEPGGPTANRPSNSLREIFFLGRPGTTATFEQRIAALDLLRSREPDVAWALLFELIPSTTEHSRATASPVYRDWRPDEWGTVMMNEFLHATAAVSDRVIEDAGHDGVRLANLLARVAPIDLPAREQLIEAIEGLNPQVLDSDGRKALTRTIRDIVVRHRRFADVQWSMPSDLVNRLDAALETLQDSDPISRHEWLFAPGAQLAFPGGDPQEQSAALIAAQDAALAEVLAERGLEGVLSWASTIDKQLFAANAVAAALARSVGVAPDDVLTWITSNEDADREVVARYATFKAWQHGSSWAIETLKRYRDKWSLEHQTMFLVALPASLEVWNLVEELGNEEEKSYWALMDPYRLPTDGELARDAVERLIGAEQARKAIHLIAAVEEVHHVHIPSTLIAQTLEEAAKTATSPFSYEDALHVGQLLDYLYERGYDSQHLAQLEWQYLPLFRFEQRQSQVLHRKLSEDPAFFVSVVSTAYLGEGEQPTDPSEEERARATVALDLLRSWRLIPRTRPDGSLDGPALLAWIEDARRSLAEAKRLAVGDRWIGRVLCYGPSSHRPNKAQLEEGPPSETSLSPTDAWPAVEIRDAIEKVASSDLESAFSVEYYNSRGSTMRGCQRTSYSRA